MQGQSVSTPVLQKHCGNCSEVVDAQLRKLKCSNGAIQLKFQCFRCGRSIGNALPQTTIPSLDSAPFWDETFEAAERERYEHSRETFEVKLQRYHDYLVSPQWAEKRAAVLHRDANLCQGCRIFPATQVHHLTYAHIFSELLFELVSICERCHRHCHNDPSTHDLNR